MSSLAEAIRQAGERMRTELGVDADLQDVTRRVGDMQTLAEAVSTARQLLGLRRRALEKAQSTVAQLSDTVIHLARVLPFTEEGWPERRAALLAQLDAGLPKAVAAWLDHWFTAAGDRRLDALARLREDVVLPAGAALVHDRALAAEVGLNQGMWVLASPMLRVGVSGLDLAGRRVPDIGTSERLRLLLARLALSEQLLDEANGLLETGDDADGTAARLALRARLARARGETADADALREQAQELDPRDLDVTVELVHRARQENELHSALDAARVAVDALLSLADVEVDFGRLITPPAELWVAAAERSVREGDKSGAAHLLDQALAWMDWTDHELGAVIYEARAELAATDHDRRRALVTAGEHRLNAYQMERAQLDFEAASTGEVTDPDEVRDLESARLRWADTVCVLAWPRPVSAVHAELEKALYTVLTAQTRIDVSTSESWSYQTETLLRHQLARNFGPERPHHLWAALLAAARAAALDPAQSFRWLTVAEAALELNMFRVGETAARRAYQLQRNENTLAGHVQALVNVGSYDAALERPADADDAWSQCVRGYALLRMGDCAGSIQLFENAVIDPAWVWAWTTYVSALVIREDFERARRESKSYSRALTTNSGDRYTLLAALFDARIHGDFALSLQLSQEFRSLAGDRDDEANDEVGQALVLTGDSSGWEFIADSISRSPTRNKLAGWEQVTRPVLQALVAAHGLAPLDFSILEPTLSTVRQGLDHSATPVAELRNAEDQAGDIPVAAYAAVLTEAVLESVDVADVADLERVLQPLTTFPAEAAALRRYGLDRLARAERSASARAAVDDAVSGRASAATDTLRKILMEAPTEVSALLQGETTGEVPESILDVLRKLGEEPEHVEAVQDVLASLGADPDGEQAPGYQFKLLLPKSWFTGVEDPVREHPLFVRFLPELRRRADWTVPPVSIAARYELEPADYRVVADDDVLASGSVDPGLRYCADDALNLLTPGVRSDPRTHWTPHGWGIPADLFDGDPEASGELFTMPAAEVIARVFGDVVRTSASLAETETSPASTG